MNIDQFLAFWSAHNIVIIEGLIAAILLVAVALSYSMLFGKKDAEDSSASAVNAEQIEKTLQKILEAQSHAPAKETSLVSPTSSDPAAAAVGEELAQLRQALTEKESQIELLKTQVGTGGGVATSAADGAAPAAASAPGMSAEDKLALENKIKDLEARLSEYEIISEDIADLSRYKEENMRLQRELDALRSGAGAPAPAPAAAAAAPTPAPAPEPEPPAPVAAAPIPEPTPAPTPEPEKAVPAAEAAPAPAAEAAPAPAVAAAETPAEPAAEASSVIDDDLMKEFAAAVEGQKASSASNETDKLMNDFENFIKKG